MAHYQNETQKSTSKNPPQGSENSGNFKNNPEKAAQAGRKGGQASQQSGSTKNR